MALSLISFWGIHQVEAASKKKAKVKVSKENLKAHKAYEKWIKEIRKNPKIFKDYLYDDVTFTGEFEVDKVGFAYHDFNKDGVDELLLSIDKHEDAHFLMLLSSIQY